jgi:hypothetical protein
MVYAFERLFGQPGGTRIFLLPPSRAHRPMYWAATTIFLIYVLPNTAASPQRQRRREPISSSRSYLFIPTRPDGWAIPLLAVGWTLNYEMFFYALFGLLIALPRRTVVMVIAALFCALIAIRLLGPAAAQSLPELVQSDHRRVRVRDADRARLSRRRTHSGLGGTHARCRRHCGVRLVVEPGRISSVRTRCCACSPGAFRRSRSSARSRYPRQPVAANLFWRVCGFLGDASYSLYLVHTLALGVPVIVLGRFVDPASAPWLYLALIVLATVIPPLIVYVYVEKAVSPRSCSARSRDASARRPPRWPRPQPHPDQRGPKSKCLCRDRSGRTFSAQRRFSIRRQSSGWRAETARRSTSAASGCANLDTAAYPARMGRRRAL